MMVDTVELGMAFVWFGIGAYRLLCGEPVPPHIFFLVTLVVAVGHVVRAVGA